MRSTRDKRSTVRIHPPRGTNWSHVIPEGHDIEQEVQGARLSWTYCAPIHLCFTFRMLKEEVNWIQWLERQRALDKLNWQGRL